MAEIPDNPPKIIRKRLGKQKADGVSHYLIKDGLRIFDNVIYVDSRLTGFNEMLTHIHESHHIGLPSSVEEHVEKISTYVAKMLWSAGYRKVDLGP